MALTAKGTPYVVSTDLVANYPTVSSDLATHIDDKLTYNIQTINPQTGTTYTFALADATLYKLVTASNAAASTYTVPPQSSVTWLDGSVLRLVNQGAGAVTLVGGSGVTLSGASLVLSQYQGATLIRTASNAWTVIGIASTPGLTQIASSTFTAVSAVNVNNCFSSTYQNYRILVRATTSSGAGQTTFRLRASGTDAATNYNFQTMYAGVSAGNQNETGQTGWMRAGSYSAGAAGIWISLDVFRPNEVATTQGHCTTGDSRPFIISYSGEHTTASAYDGISWLIDAGTFSGTIRVYGYKD